MTRRLYRSRRDRILGGVAAGLADYLNADVALVRIAWAILVVITNGVGLLAYIVAWIVVPEEPKAVAAARVDATDRDAEYVATEEGTAVVEPARPGEPVEPDERRESRAGLVVGIGLVLLGVWFLLREYVPDIEWSLLWPIVLIGVGALILFNSARNRDRP